MIRINNINHNEIFFEYGKINSTESLHIKISGELLTNSNKLHITYNNKSYFGCKLIPHFRKGITDFFVYIYQKGDSELC